MKYTLLHRLAMAWLLFGLTTGAGAEPEQSLALNPVADAEICPPAPSTAGPEPADQQSVPGTVSQRWEFLTPRNDWADPDIPLYGFTLYLRNTEQRVAKVTVAAHTGDSDLGVIERFSLKPGATYVIKSATLGGVVPDATARLAITASRLLNAYEMAGPLGGEEPTLIEGSALDQPTPAAGDALSTTAAINIVQPAVTSCCGYSSSGNPYSCRCSSKPDTGNCTWWAWKKARDEWNQNLPGWGDAKTWADRARAAGYPVKSKPASNTIAVSSRNHVCWVKSVSGSTVNCSEMNWCYTCKRDKSYATSYFDKGFIYKK